MLSERAQQILIKAAELARESGRADLEEMFLSKLADERQEDAEEKAGGGPDGAGK